MKIYHNIEEVRADIKDGVLKVNDDIEIAFDGFEIDANIECRNIYSKNYKRSINAWDINAWDINAWDINAGDINAGDINAWDINAYDINAGDINAGDINAWDINAYDINAGDINANNINAWDINAWDINAKDISAGDISYYAFCVTYTSFKCTSVEGRRENSAHQCLDSEIVYKEKEDDRTQEVIKMLKEAGYKIVKE